jgi:hypothetical protein
MRGKDESFVVDREGGRALHLNRKLNMPAQLACSEHHLQHARS